MKKMINSKTFLLWIITLQESFGAAIPFLFLTSLLILIQVFFSYFQVNLPLFNVEYIAAASHGLSHFSSLVIAISAAYFFAIRLKLLHVIVILLTVAVYSTLVVIEYPTTELYLLPGFSATMLYAPLASAFFLQKLYPYLNLRIPLHDANRHVYLLFNYLLVFVVAYVLIVALYYGGDLLLDHWLGRLRETLQTIPKIIYFTIRSFLVHVLWFLGIPGENTVSLFFPYGDFLKQIVPHLNYLEFNRLFINIGGAGSGLAILVTALMFAKTKTLKLITYISIPFAFFNINTLILYAFIVLNRFLLLPFLLIPMVNLALAFLFVKMVPIAYSSTFTVVWNTPVFLDGYLKSQGDLRVLGFQVFLLLVDVLIYLSFMRRFAVTQSLPGHLSVLAKNLDIKAEIESEKNLLAYQAYSEIIDANSQLDYILKDLQPKNMFIYYQPKINLSMGTSTEFEALIRYWNQGKMTGPIFLDTIEKAGMAPIIDLWVCQQVQYDLQKWHENNFYPSISINLHPDTLLNIKAIEHIRTIFEKKNVTFEIVERSFLDQNAAQENLQTLRDNHHRISIDDFGTGYSNLGIMIRLHIDELKLDKSLIDVIHTPKGYAICRGVIRYCHEVGIDVVAEGVETPQQVQILTELEVDTIQGFIYSKAIPFDQAYAFSHNFSKNHHKEKS